jgi:hypothetical protein
MANIKFEQYHGQDTREASVFNADFEYNGQPYLSQKMRHDRTKHTSDNIYAEDIGKLKCLLDGLVQEGSIPAAAWKLNPDDFVKALGPDISVPDFRVRLVSGDEIYVETTTAGEQATIHQDNKLWDMSNAIGQWVMSDTQAQAKLGGHELAFGPQRMFKGKDEKAALEEMKVFALTEDLLPYKQDSEMKIRSKKYPVLTQSEVIV